MKRIDMLCKLIAPLAISALMTILRSEKIVAAVLATVSILSWVFECWCVQQVWNENSRLRAPKFFIHDASKDPETTSHFQSDRNSDTKDQSTVDTPNLLLKVSIYVKRLASAHVDGLRYYLSTPVWIPSFCAAVPHASVLTYSGTLMTYLLNSGFLLNTVTIARFTGALFEIGSTFVYPRAVRVLSRANPEIGWYRVASQDVSLSNSLGNRAAERQSMELNPKSSISELGIVKVGLCGSYTLFLSLVSIR